MRRLLAALVALSVGFAAIPAFAEDGPRVDPPPARAFVIGPRIGASYSWVDPVAYSNALDSMFNTPGVEYSPVLSLIALNMEYRILLGDTRDHFAIQGMIGFAGIEQSIFVPSLALLLGYRSESGFEIGVGPYGNPSGVGIVVALGYTFSFGGVYLPVDVSFLIPNRNLYAALSVTCGFNFVSK